MEDRNRPGEIRDAIVTVLSASPAQATPSAIKQAVSAYLGRDVPASSVRSYLQLNTPGIFTRSGPGKYQLTSMREVNQLDFTVDSRVEEYEVGRAKLLRTDCFSWLRSAPSCSVHAVVTDPPYGLVEYSRKEQRKLRSRQGGVWRIPPAYDGVQRAPLPRFTTLTQADLDSLHEFFLGWARALGRVLVPGAHVFVASNPLVSHVVSDALSRGGLERRGAVIRLVMTLRGGDRPKNAHKEFADVTVMPRSMWEPWLLYRKPLEGRVQDNLRKWKTGGLRRVSESGPFGDVIKSQPTRGPERKIAPHPSLKPQAFMRRIVRAALPLGVGVVLDPFAGSGSTLAAAEAVGYESLGIELDDEYFKMARDAIARLAALPVKHHSDRDRPSSI
jgi:site-specific DNA-methyltransferase (adenine-specific)